MPSRSRSWTAPTVDDSDTGPPGRDDGITAILPARGAPRWVCGQPVGVGAVESAVPAAGVDSVAGASLVGVALDDGAVPVDVAAGAEEPLVVAVGGRLVVADGPLGGAPDVGVAVPVAGRLGVVGPDDVEDPRLEVAQPVAELRERQVRPN